MDVAAERKKLIGAIPPTQSGLFESELTPEGDYVYEAASARPLTEGDKFSVPGNTKFDIRVTEAYHYICHFG